MMQPAVQTAARRRIPVLKPGWRKEGSSMEYREKSVLPLIESAYEQLSAAEKTIADFFLKNREQQDFSARRISSLLAVSEASLSRFAKKCGCRGYREFIYLYESSLQETSQTESVNDSSRKVLLAYEELLNKSWSLMNEAQLHTIGQMMAQARRVFCAGKGSSAFAAEEMAYRFMRIGVDIEALTDSSIMRMQSIMRQKKDLCFGLSLSGRTPEILEFLAQARERGAWTVLITANYREPARAYCDEILLVPSLQHLNHGNLISPQFPLLVMTDLLYGIFMNQDRENRESLLSKTVQLVDAGTAS